MDIKSISSASSVTPPSGGVQRAASAQAQQQVSRTDRRDRLELSPQAQNLRESQRSEKLNQVRSRLSSGYYDSPEVINETAKLIDKAL
jgi:hypothetical protein